MHPSLRLVVMVLMACASLPAGQAAAADVAVCTGGWVVTASSGLGLSPTSSTYTTELDHAYIDCIGSLAGRQVTGPAEYVEQGTIEGDCSHGGGEGTFDASVPTSDGVVRITGAFSYAWAGPTGYFEGERFSGWFEFYPIEGDCVTSPARKARVFVQGVLR